MPKNQPFLLTELENEFAARKPVNVASVPHRSPFRYPGGKTWFVPTFRNWISSLPEKLIPMTNTHHATMLELVIGKDLSWMEQYCVASESPEQYGQRRRSSESSVRRERCDA